MKLNLGGRWDEERDGPYPEAPQPPLSKPNPERALFAKVCLVLLVGALIAGALWFTKDQADAAGDIRQLPDCVTAGEAHTIRHGDTRHQLRVRIGGQTPEFYQADRIRDYPACNPWYGLRIRYRADSWRVAAAFWLSCPRHHVAECTRERIL